MSDLLHKCLECGNVLSKVREAMECSRCGRAWPILNNVPVYDSAKYFGEISLEEMEQVCLAAEVDGWRTAIRKHFKGSNADMYQYVVDLHRASWIPLLPIGPDSTVLDVGCGLGAITHALALNYERVVAIEPITQRVRFTKARIDQEGLKNVDLIQTSLNALPFFEKSFDLIILNGILEWVGEWRMDRTPRELQLEALRTLRGMLKPNGVILIGIENRIGFDSFLGRLDHTGQRFTNLMPRWMASFYLKLKRPGFYRTWMDSSARYRTYTYSPRGYRKLLSEGGFKSVEFWWPPDGYNLPHFMCRATSRKEIYKYFERDRHYRDRVVGYRFRRALKDWLLVKTGLIFSMFPDLIIIARETSDVSKTQNQSLVSSLKRILTKIHGAQNEEQAYAAALHSYSFRNKIVIKFVTAKGSVQGFAKVSNVRLPQADGIESTFQCQRSLVAAFKHNPLLVHTVPSPIERTRIGNLVASVEEPACGTSLDTLSLAPQYFRDQQRVKRHLEFVATWLVSVQKLGALSSKWPRTIPGEWRYLPGDRTEQRSVSQLSWVQHGDFFPENVFVDESARRICVIDWEHCGDGYPPFFDWFCLVTGLYYTQSRISRLPKGQTVDGISFKHTYFGSSWFSEVVKTLTYQICDQLGLARAEVIGYFREYLAVRYHQFLYAENSGAAEQWCCLYKSFCDFFMSNQQHCIFFFPTSHHMNIHEFQPLTKSVPPSSTAGSIVHEVDG